jgi:hypothetical protein
MGDHAVCYRKNNTLRRHNCVAETLAHLAQAARVTVSREVPIPPLQQASPDAAHASNHNSRGFRPADVMLGIGVTGHFAVDIMGMHPLPPSQSHTAHSSTCLLLTAEDTKV